MQIGLPRGRAWREKETDKGAELADETGRERTKTHLSENGAVHGGRSGRRMRNEMNPEPRLGKLGTVEI